MIKSEINEILAAHKKWLDGEPNGKQADFTGADLTDADFTGAKLKDADFTGACLTSAKFRDANIIRADFRQANLSGADFSWADVSMAKFSGADLRGANFSGANLRWANISMAKLGSANFTGADLDCSCLPLWCGSLSAKFDKKHYIQFLYHTLKSLEANDLIDDEFKKSLLTTENILIANQFHRADECGKITACKTLLKANSIKIDNTNILQAAINKMEEFAKGICKYRRGDSNVMDITQEIADVEIVLMLLKMMMDIRDDDVELAISGKLARLEEGMEETKNG